MCIILFFLFCSFCQIQSADIFGLTTQKDEILGGLYLGFTLNERKSHAMVLGVFISSIFLKPAHFWLFSPNYRSLFTSPRAEIRYFWWVRVWAEDAKGGRINKGYHLVQHICPEPAHHGGWLEKSNTFPNTHRDAHKSFIGQISRMYGRTDGPSDDNRRAHAHTHTVTQSNIVKSCWERCVLLHTFPWSHKPRSLSTSLALMYKLSFPATLTLLCLGRI